MENIEISAFKLEISELEGKIQTLQAEKNRAIDQLVIFLKIKLAVIKEQANDLDEEFDELEYEIYFWDKSQRR